MKPSVVKVTPEHMLPCSSRRNISIKDPIQEHDGSTVPPDIQDRFNFVARRKYDVSLDYVITEMFQASNIAFFSFFHKTPNKIRIDIEENLLRGSKYPYMLPKRVSRIHSRIS